MFAIISPVCRHCGNDLKIPESLTAEKNAELKERVAILQRDLAELQSRLALRKKSR
jgi:uncharacterized small protein (DUF1192 family)